MPTLIFQATFVMADGSTAVKAVRAYTLEGATNIALLMRPTAVSITVESLRDTYRTIQE